MRIIDGISAAAFALRANVLRSALTTLGIVIGVGAVVAMVAIGAGAEHPLHLGEPVRPVPGQRRPDRQCTPAPRIGRPT